MLNEEDTNASKSAISEAEFYQQIGEFWDNHDLADYWKQTQPDQFIVNLHSDTIYYRLDISLSNGICSLAQRRGVTAEMLLNLWVQEKPQQERA